MARVLIAEDDDGVRFAVASVLRREGFQVDVAANGREALERASTHQYALVILDIEMPGVDGLEVCRRLRELETKSSILMLTCRDDEVDVVAGLDAGADDYVTKPFRPAELLARVRAHVRRAPGDEIFAGPVTVDRSTRRAFKDDEELHLSPREFDLLAHLVANAGRTVTREELVKALWGEWFGSPKTLDMHVLALRRKLCDDASAPRHIKTIRGVGLRFEA